MRRRAGGRIIRGAAGGGTRAEDRGRVTATRLLGADPVGEAGDGEAEDATAGRLDDALADEAAPGHAESFGVDAELGGYGTAFSLGVGEAGHGLEHVLFSLGRYFPSGAKE